MRVAQVSAHQGMGAAQQRVDGQAIGFVVVFEVDDFDGFERVGEGLQDGEFAAFGVDFEEVDFLVELPLAKEVPGMAKRYGDRVAAVQVTGADGVRGRVFLAQEHGDLAIAIEQAEIVRADVRKEHCVLLQQLICLRARFEGPDFGLRVLQGEINRRGPDIRADIGDDADILDEFNLGVRLAFKNGARDFQAKIRIKCL